jgi:catechol 2,3-dioxygenase-like lactoylglutathione lyase family enzyme
MSCTSPRWSPELSTTSLPLRVWISRKSSGARLTAVTNGVRPATRVVDASFRSKTAGPEASTRSMMTSTRRSRDRAIPGEHPRPGQDRDQVSTGYSHRPSADGRPRLRAPRDRHRGHVRGNGDCHDQGTRRHVDRRHQFTHQYPRRSGATRRAGLRLRPGDRRLPSVPARRVKRGSTYFRDPDGNLVEVSRYHDPHESPRPRRRRGREAWRIATVRLRPAHTRRRTRTRQ